MGRGRPPAHLRSSPGDRVGQRGDLPEEGARVGRVWVGWKEVDLEVRHGGSNADAPRSAGVGGEPIPVTAKRVEVGAPVAGDTDGPAGGIGPGLVRLELAIVHA